MVSDFKSPIGHYLPRATSTSSWTRGRGDGEEPKKSGRGEVLQSQKTKGILTPASSSHPIILVVLDASGAVGVGHAPELKAGDKIRRDTSFAKLFCRFPNFSTRHSAVVSR